MLYLAASLVTNRCACYAYARALHTLLSCFSQPLWIVSIPMPTPYARQLRQQSSHIKNMHTMRTNVFRQAQQKCTRRGGKEHFWEHLHHLHKNLSFAHLPCNICIMAYVPQHFILWIYCLALYVISYGPTIQYTHGISYAVFNTCTYVSGPSQQLQVIWRIHSHIHILLLPSGMLNCMW